MRYTMSICCCLYHSIALMNCISNVLESLRPSPCVEAPVERLTALSSLRDCLATWRQSGRDE